MVNKVILVGRLGKDPEMRYTAGGVPVTHFSLATDESWKDQNGERQKRTEWHNIVVWNKLAETCNQYLSKGKMVYIEGRIQTREWDDKDGNKRRTTEIVASDMRMLERKSEGAPMSEGPAERPAPAAKPMEPGITDDDIPF
jgi:single-strand DNA-binding protein